MQNEGELNCATTGNACTDWQGNYWCRQWWDGRFDRTMLYIIHSPTSSENNRV